MTILSHLFLFIVFCQIVKRKLALIRPFNLKLFLWIHIFSKVHLWLLNVLYFSNRRIVLLIDMPCIPNVIIIFIFFVFMIPKLIIPIRYLVVASLASWWKMNLILSSNVLNCWIVILFYHCACFGQKACQFAWRIWHKGLKLSLFLIMAFVQVEIKFWQRCRVLEVLALLWIWIIHTYLNWLINKFWIQIFSRNIFVYIIFSYILN